MNGETLILLAALLWSSAPGSAAQQRQAPSVEREIIPGSELMTSRERERYRQRMRGARTADEKAAVREGHVKQMRERARLRGLALPEPQKKEAP